MFKKLAFGHSFDPTVRLLTFSIWHSGHNWDQNLVTKRLLNCHPVHQTVIKTGNLTLAMGNMVSWHPYISSVSYLLGLCSSHPLKEPWKHHSSVGGATLTVTFFTANDGISDFAAVCETLTNGAPNRRDFSCGQIRRAKWNNDFEKSPVTTNTHEPLERGVRSLWVRGCVANRREVAQPARCLTLGGGRGRDGLGRAWCFLYRPPDAVNNGQLRMVGRTAGDGRTLGA